MIFYILPYRFVKYNKPSFQDWGIISLTVYHEPELFLIVHLYFRSAYPLGLPEEFTFVAVLRMTGSTVNKDWNIWQMQDVNGNEQLSVGLNGESESLEFTFTALEAGRQTIVFGPLALLFDDQWHRILLEVSRRSVALFVDCVMIESQTTPLRQKVSLDGFTLIGKLKNNPVVATPVRL